MSEAPAAQEPVRHPVALVGGAPAPPGHRGPAKRAGGAVVVFVLAATALVALYLERKAPFELAAPLEKIERRLLAKHRAKWLAALGTSCRTHDCACAKKAAEVGLDVEATDAVLELAKQGAACAAVDFDGFRAEALVRKGDQTVGLEEATRVLARSANNPNAIYARALSSYRRHDSVQATALAEASERAGRGWSATLLVGLVAFQTGDGERARRAFRALLSLDPDDIDALFNLGVAAQAEGRYGEARTSYLRITRLDPRNADARHNLAILAHSVGATDEAGHHLAKFVELSPGDPRLGELRAALAEPPEHGPAYSPTAAPPVPSAAPKAVTP